MDLPDNQRNNTPSGNAVSGFGMSQDLTTKDLKVRLPVSYHMKLQTLKILKGKSMSVAFCEALDMYFADRGQNKETLAALHAMLV